MKLRHATRVANLPAILRRGLLCCRAKGKLPAVWFHTAGATGWAILHVAMRQRCRPESVVVLEVDLPRSWLRRHGDHWYCRRDVPADRIGRLVSFAEKFCKTA